MQIGREGGRNQSMKKLSFTETRMSVFSTVPLSLSNQDLL